MDRKDAIAFKIATMPANIAKKSTLTILACLEKKYPENYKVKRNLVLHYIKNGQLEEAESKLLPLAFNHQKYSDFALLISLCFANGTNLNSGILQKIENLEDQEILSETVNILNSHSFVVKNTCLFTEKYKIILDGNSDRDNHRFFKVYIEIIRSIKDRRFGAALRQTFEIFKIDNYHDAIQFMIDNQKTELLFYLSSHSDFFRKYYDQSLRNTLIELIETLAVTISTRSLRLVIEFASMLESSEIKTEKHRNTKKREKRCPFI